MKLGILHLSDLHFRDAGNAAFDKTTEVVSAFQSADPLVEACIVIVTGDLGSSGKSSEYGQAMQFLEELQKQLDGADRPRCAGICLVPGNHDCDFTKDTPLRQVVLEAFTSGSKDLEERDEMARALLVVQADFFYLEALFARRIDTPEDPQGWISARTVFHVGDRRVVVNAYNTALTSQLPERQGQLRFPLRVLGSGQGGGTDDDLIVSIFHHPYRWLEGENSRLFQKHVETTSDLVLTGHEHEEAAYSTQRLTGEEVEYLEGEALQHRDGRLGGFNVVTWDFDRKEHKISQFTWAETRFTLVRESSWLLPVRNRAARRSSFENSAEFLRSLNDPGTGFTHPRKADLTLDDLFVYPDLSTESLKRLRGVLGRSKNIGSERTLDYIASKQRVLICGGDKSGKTALARKLFLDLKTNHRLVPLFVSGADLVSGNERTILDCMYAKFRTQYRPDQLEAYIQLPLSRRVLIVDDWHKTRLNYKGQLAVVAVAKRFFGKIIVFAGDILPALALATREVNPFNDFDDCEIKEFGNYLRGKLIDRWETLGRECTAEDETLVHEIHEAEKLVLTLLGKNLLPSYPVIILSVLQTWEAGRAGDAQAGSYGYLIEVLITTALAKVSKGFTDLNAKNIFISRLAYHLFRTRRQTVTEAEVQRLTEQYFAEYSIRLNTASILRDLEEAQIIRGDGGNYRFSYRYYYYYFVARYLADNLRDKKEQAHVRGVLEDMADKVHSEEYSSILVFVVYRTQDAGLIEHILQNAKQIYAAHTPCDFERDVEFLNKLYEEPPKMLLPATDVRENIEENRRRLDAAREEAEDQVPSGEEEPVKYSDELTDLLKINIALKNLQLMGQVLRNFAGSLRKEVKIEIARSAYQLGLRTLNAILRMGESNLEQLRSYLAQLIREYRTFDQKELERKADDAVVFLTRRIAYSFVKRISYAVGHSMLEQTYRDVVTEEGDRTSIRLVDLSVKLDHFSGFPQDDVLEMWDRLKKTNFFSSTVLRDMVANYLYLFQADYTIRQRIGKLLQIETRSPEMMDDRSKKLPRRAAWARGCSIN
jgi:hypothetical protein